MEIINDKKIMQKILNNIPTYLKWVLIYFMKGNWRLGTEMAFWDIELNKRRPKDWIEPTHKDVYHAIKYLNNHFNETPRVLEIGPGPRSRLTTPYDKELINLYAIDPLADDFKKYLGGRRFLIQGTGETTIHSYPENNFHMTYASNVLDHSENPLECFVNLIKLTMTEGLIIIQGNVNEGDRTNWLGLHRYNIWIDENKLMCKTKNGEPFELTKNQPIKKFYYRLTNLDGNPWFSIIYKKDVK